MKAVFTFIAMSALTFFVLGWLSNYELWHERTVLAIAIASCLPGAIVTFFLYGNDDV